MPNYCPPSLGSSFNSRDNSLLFLGNMFKPLFEIVPATTKNCMPNTREDSLAFLLDYRRRRTRFFAFTVGNVFVLRHRSLSPFQHKSIKLNQSIIHKEVMLNHCTKKLEIHFFLNSSMKKYLEILLSFSLVVFPFIIMRYIRV